MPDRRSLAVFVASFWFSAAWALAQPGDTRSLLAYQGTVLDSSLHATLAATDQCPQRYRVVRRLGAITEWLCPALAAPGGALGGASARQQLMAKDGRVFAVATILDETDEGFAADVEEFYRSGLARDCACVPAEDKVLYCQCPEAETRLVRVGRSIGVLTIGQGDTFLHYLAEERKAESQPASGSP